MLHGFQIEEAVILNKILIGSELPNKLFFINGKVIQMH